MAVIDVCNLTKKYGDFTAVDNISFKIEKGEIVGFVGKNGAGKSTTIRTLLNFLFPSSGSCSICDLDCSTESDKIKSMVGYMPSDAIFPKNTTAKEILSFCQSFSKQGKEYTQQLAKYFELDLSKAIDELSLGNRKKVSIIQALLKGGEVLILDEPTSGLDPLMQELFFKKLLSEREKGVTIFLSSHNLSEIEKYCDRVIIIKDGKIVEEIDLSNRKVELSQIVTYTDSDGKTETFEFSGDANELIKKLSTINLLSVEIKNKTIEDEFIKYYEEGSHE